MTDFDIDNIPSGPPSAETPETSADVNPRTKRAYTMSAEERAAVGQRLAAARKAKSAERGMKPGSRNPLAGKSTRPGRTAPPMAKTATAKKDPDHYKGADKIAGWVSIGGAFLAARNPVQGNIIAIQGQRLGGVLRGLGDADDRVKDALTRVSEWMGPASAWSDAAAWGGTTLAALMLSSGRAPGGVVGVALAAVAGSLVDAATMAAEAQAAAAKRAQRDADPDGVDGASVP